MAGRPVKSRRGETPAQMELYQPGAMVALEGRTARIHTVERGSSGRLDVLLDWGDGLERIPIREFYLRVSASKPPTPAQESLVVPPELVELSPSERDRVSQRYRDLLEVVTGSRRGTPEIDREAGTLSERFDPEQIGLMARYRTKSDELRQRGEQFCSVATLRRQAAAIETEGIGALIHGNRKRWTDHLAHADQEVVDLLSTFLKEEAPKARISNRALCRRARAALDAAGLATGMSSYKLGQLVDELSRSLELHHEAAGRERVSMKPAVSYGRRSVSRPGEIVQIDATTTNIHVWDPRLGWVRSTIVTAIDVFSRCVLALRVVNGAVTSRDAAMLLWDIGRPAVTRSGYPYELETHVGMPRLVSVRKDVDPHETSELIGHKPGLSVSSVVIDHGREFDSAHFMSACAQAGMDLVFCPPRAAHAKGVIEAFHNALREIQSLLIAYKGAAPTNHPKGVEELATLTGPDLRDALWEYLIDIHHWKPHRGLADLHSSQAPLCPAGVVEAYLASGGGLTVPNDPYALIRFMTPVQRTLQPYGLNIDGRTYTSSELIALRPRLGRGIGVAAAQITVYYDRNDVSRVYVRHPKTLQWLMVPRAASSPDERMPCSDMFDRALRDQIIRRDGQPMSEAQADQMSADFISRWASVDLEDRNAARVLALESGRAHDYAHDLADASPEFRELAFGSPAGSQPLDLEVVDGGPSDSDEILDADLVDDEDIDLDALDGEDEPAVPWS